MSTFLLEQLSRTKVHKKMMLEEGEGRGRDKLSYRHRKDICAIVLFFLQRTMSWCNLNLDLLLTLFMTYTSKKQKKSSIVGKNNEK